MNQLELEVVHLRGVVAAYREAVHTNNVAREAREALMFGREGAAEAYAAAMKHWAEAKAQLITWDRAAPAEVPLWFTRNPDSHSVPRQPIAFYDGLRAWTQASGGPGQLQLVAEVEIEVDDAGKEVWTEYLVTLTTEERLAKAKAEGISWEQLLAAEKELLLIRCEGDTKQARKLSSENWLESLTALD